MKTLLLAAALCLGFSPVFAASVTIPNGAISLVYVNAAGVVVAQPYASISDTVAGTFSAWCEAKYIGTAGANTTLGCLNTWYDDWINQMKAGMQATAQNSAAAAAIAAVPPTIITPAQ